MQAIITYINRNPIFADAEEQDDFEENLKPNKGDWIAYSANQTIRFKNSFFRLKPGRTAYMEIKFAWPIKANKLGNTDSSVFSVDPEIGWVTVLNPQTKLNETQDYTDPVFWNVT